MSEHWSERHEGGGRFAIWLLVTIGVRCGRGFSRVLLYPIALYFYLRRGPERRASRAFLERALGRAPSIWQVMRHIHCFAVTTLDRVYLLSESLRRFDIRINGLDHIEALLAQGRGLLMFGAHIGSFEALRALADRRPDLQVRILMDKQQMPAMNDLLLALNPAVAASVIDAGGAGSDVALAIQEAAAAGAIIAVLADRARTREPMCTATFFGSEAAFPVAPYLLASVLQLPTVLSFALYRGGNRYDLYFETFADSIRIPRAERGKLLSEWTQRFASRLEYYTRLDPYNWFNFYDFWHRPDAGASADADAAGSAR